MALPQIPTDYVAHWPGSISGGNLVDEGGSYPAAITGGVARAIGRVGEAALFDGAAGTDADILAAMPAGAFTVGGFASFARLNGDEPLLGIGQGSGGAETRLLIRANSTTLEAQFATGATTVDTLTLGAVAVDDEFHWAVKIASGGAVAVYFNGLVAATGTGAAFETVTTALLGASPAGAINGNAWLNRTRLYSYDLSDDEIKAWALERATIPTTNLVAAWSYADLAAGVVPDSVGSNDLTATGGAPKTGMRVNVGVDYDNPTSAAVPTDYDELTTPIVLSGDFTLSFAVTPDGVKDKIALCGDDGSPRSILALTASTGVVEIDNGTAYASPGAGALTAGQEYVVEITRSGSAIEFWLDGVSVGTWAAFSGDFTIRYLGTWTTASDSLHSTWKHGQPRIYSAVLDASDVALIATERPRVPTLGLVSRWTMDNINGSTLVDEMGANDGTITGAIQAAGIVGDALEFSNAQDDRVDAQITAGSGKDKFAVSMMVKAYSIGSTAASDGRHLFAIGGVASANRSFAVAYKGNIYVVTYADDRDTGIAAPAVNENARLLIKQDNGVVEIWIGGALEWTDTFVNLDYSNSAQRIGAWWGGNIEAFDGLIDQVHAYGDDHDLDALDALALANEPPPYFVSGVVDDSADSSPLAASIKVHKASDGTLLGSAVAAADGSYQIELDTADLVNVTAEKSGYWPQVLGPIDPSAA